MELITAIALLCGNVGGIQNYGKEYRLSETEVLQCQKYYIKCVEKNSRTGAPNLEQCILDKIKLGGDR